MTQEQKASRLERGFKRGPEVEIIVDGQPVVAYGGETVATALLAHGHLTCQEHRDRPLGVFCNIGVCHSCLMTIDGISAVRSCQTEVHPGMTVETRSFHKGRS